MAVKRNSKINDLSIIAIFSALVIVLQFVARYSSVVTGINFTLSLTPIIICGALTGIKGGLITGAVFGAMTVVNAVTGGDIWTAALLQLNANTCILTVVICFVKAVLAGVVSALIYKLLKNKNQYAAIITASVAAPVVNTALFILLALIVLSDSFSTLAASGNAMFAGSDKDIIYYLVIGCAGVNFIVEFLINVILAPAVHRIIKAVK